MVTQTPQQVNKCSDFNKKKQQSANVKKKKQRGKMEVDDAQTPASLQVCVDVLVDRQLQGRLLHAAGGPHTHTHTHLMTLHLVKTQSKATQVDFDSVFDRGDLKEPAQLA